MTLNQNKTMDWEDQLQKQHHKRPEPFSKVL